MKLLSSIVLFSVVWTIGFKQRGEVYQKWQDWHMHTHLSDDRFNCHRIQTECDYKIELGYFEWKEGHCGPSKSAELSVILNYIGDCEWEAFYELTNSQINGVSIEDRGSWVNGTKAFLTDSVSVELHFDILNLSDIKGISFVINSATLSSGSIIILAGKKTTRDSTIIDHTDLLMKGRSRYSIDVHSKTPLFPYSICRIDCIDG